MIQGSRFMIYGLRFVVSDLGFKVFEGCFTERRKPKILQHLARGEGFVQGVRCPDSYKGGGRSPTPHGTNPEIVKGDKARGGGGVVPGGVNTREFPQVRRCV